MADNALAKAGLYFDELNKVRLLRPPVAHDAADLRDESRTFISQIDQFESSNEALMQAMTQLAKLVDQEKLRAIASRNAINNLDKIRQNQNQQLQVIVEYLIEFT
jgi:intraflagellar transport protein 20